MLLGNWALIYFNRTEAPVETKAFVRITALTLQLVETLDWFMTDRSVGGGQWAEHIEPNTHSYSLTPLCLIMHMFICIRVFKPWKTSVYCVLKWWQTWQHTHTHTHNAMNPLMWDPWPLWGPYPVTVDLDVSVCKSWLPSAAPHLPLEWRLEKWNNWEKMDTQVEYELNLYNSL